MRGGAVEITADAVVLQSGKPVRMYGAQIVSGATAGTVAFRDGAAATATALLTDSGVANTGYMCANIPAEGILFPNGLFVDIDANTTRVIVWAELVSRA